MFKGKNLFFFFPMAGPAVVPKEMCSIREDYNALLFRHEYRETISISVDSFFTSSGLVGQQDRLPVAFGFNKIMIRDYDMILPTSRSAIQNVAKRATVVIDKEETVRYIEVLPNPGEMPNMDAIKQAVQQLG